MRACASRTSAAARAWYAQLLGEPSSLAHATEAVWMLAEDRSVLVVQDADRAGQGLVTVFVEDLDTQVGEIAARGLAPTSA